jgi:hypothetical protein
VYGLLKVHQMYGLLKVHQIVRIIIIAGVPDAGRAICFAFAGVLHDGAGR